MRIHHRKDSADLPGSSYKVAVAAENDANSDIRHDSTIVAELSMPIWRTGPDNKGMLGSGLPKTTFTNRSNEFDCYGCKVHYCLLVSSLLQQQCYLCLSQTTLVF